MLYCNRVDKDYAPAIRQKERKMAEIEKLLAKNPLHVLQLYVTDTLYVRVYRDALLNMIEEVTSKGGSVKVVSMLMHETEHGREVLELFIRFNE